MEEQKQYDVFISYSNKDYKDENGKPINGNIISQIKERLDQNGITYWIDEDGLAGGDDFAHTITKNIRASKILLFVSTQNSNESEWTNREIYEAVQNKKTIIPFKVDNTPYSAQISLLLSNLQHIDFNKDGDDALRKLVRDIKKIKNKRTKKIHAEEKDLVTIKISSGICLIALVFSAIFILIDETWNLEALKLSYGNTALRLIHIIAYYIASMIFAMAAVSSLHIFNEKRHALASMFSLAITGYCITWELFPQTLRYIAIFFLIPSLVLLLTLPQNKNHIRAFERMNKSLTTTDYLLYGIVFVVYSIFATYSLTPTIKELEVVEGNITLYTEAYGNNDTIPTFTYEDMNEETYIQFKTIEKFIVEGAPIPVVKDSKIQLRVWIDRKGNVARASIYKHSGNNKLDCLCTRMAMKMPQWSTWSIDKCDENALFEKQVKIEWSVNKCLELAQRVKIEP